MQVAEFAGSFFLFFFLKIDEVAQDDGVSKIYIFGQRLLVCVFNEVGLLIMAGELAQF